MKEQRLDILQKVANGELTPEQADKQLLGLSIVSFSLPIERFDAEDWLGENKDIWNHPIITDRNGLESYEVADLMAEFANSVISNES